MAIISLLSRLVNGVQRQVDLSSNTLNVQDIQLNNSSGYTLAGTTSGHAGSSLIGDDDSYTNITPLSATVKGALSAIDTALGTAGAAANKTLSNLTSPTAINQSLLPGVDNSIDLGSATGPLSWRTLFAYALAFPGGPAISLQNGYTTDSSGAHSVDWVNRLLVNSSSVTLANWSGSLFQASAGLDFNSHAGINLLNPVNPQDAATKNYVDNIAQGLNWKETVRAASINPLPGTYAYNNGTAGVGATITQNGTILGNALNPQDGVTLAVNDRLLVAAETSGNAPYNGIYVVTQVGDGATVPYILTRSADADTAVSLQWATVQISPDAATQAGYIFRESDDITTIGTDNVAFVIVSKGLDWIFGNGLTTSGNTVSVLANPTNPSIAVSASGVAVNLNAAGGIVSSSTGLLVQLNGTNPGLEISANALDVKYNAAGAIVASASGIAWNPDGSSLEINSNAARIKATAYDQVTITGGGGSAAAVQQSPAIKRTLIAGQAFAANTSYAVRWGVAANGETAGRIYACTTATSGTPVGDLFYCIGMASSSGTVLAGNPIAVTTMGSFALSSSDTGFVVGTDEGTAVFIGNSGAFTVTAPSSAGTAVTRIGMVQVASATATSNIIDVMPQVMGVN